MLQRTRERVAGLGFAAGWGLVKAAPAGWSRRWFAAVADAASVHNGAGTRQLRKNLRRVVGPVVTELALDELVGESLRSYARYWLETFRLPKMDHREIVARMDENFVGAEHIDAALARGNGLVIALPHQGNWDVAGLWLVNHSGSFATVAERLKPESLFDRFVEYREHLGFEVVPLTGGSRAPLDVLKERLGENKIVCLVADRDLSHNGIDVRFFGEPARMPGGPAMLAATTGATLLCASVYFTPDSWGVTVNPPLAVPSGRLRDQVPALTQVVADHFARDIAAHPADWHMLQRLWLADLPPRPIMPAGRSEPARPDDRVREAD